LIFRLTKIETPYSQPTGINRLLFYAIAVTFFLLSLNVAQLNKFETACIGLGGTVKFAKTIGKLMMVTLLAFFVIGFFSSLQATETDFTCWFSAGSSDVSVTVKDSDLDGNPISGTLWGGTIKKGQKQEVRSFTGRIRYNYKRAVDTRSRGANYGVCVNGNTIRLK
jgi:hypothetical protein